MNVQAIDLCNELRQGVEFPLAFPPVIICRPVARKLSHRRELYALRLIRYGLLLRPLGRHNPSTKLIELFLREAHLEGTNRCPGMGHSASLFSSTRIFMFRGFGNCSLSVAK